MPINLLVVYLALLYSNKVLQNDLLLCIHMAWFSYLRANTNVFFITCDNIQTTHLLNVFTQS